MPILPVFLLKRGLAAVAALAVEPVDWAAVYRRLDARYDLSVTHGVSSELFLSAPAEHERWIHIYFANPGLLVNRPHGGCASLCAFLTLGPEEILLAMLIADGKLDKTQLTAGSLPLSGQVSALAVRTEWNTVESRRFECSPAWLGWFEQNEQDRQCGGASMIGVHDGRYIQPMKHFEPTAKWKSRGVHL